MELRRMLSGDTAAFGVAVPSSAVGEGQNVTATLSGTGATLTHTLNWGDGTTQTLAAGVTSATHAYADGVAGNSTYTVSATGAIGDVGDVAADWTFGSSGRTNLSGSFTGGSSVEKIAVQSDGKVVVADTRGGNVVLTRYLASGALDTTFGTSSSGSITIDFGGTDNAAAVAVGANGKIVVAGNTGTSIAVARVTSSGALDTTFNSTGKATYAATAWFDSTLPVDLTATSLALEGGSATQDSTVFVAGSSHRIDLSLSYQDYAIVHFNADGSVDTNFGANGLSSPNFAWRNRINGIAVQTIQQNGSPVEKLVTVGSRGAVAGEGVFGVTRFNMDGSVDTSFEGSGSGVSGAFVIYSTSGNGLSIASDGTITTVGTYQPLLGSPSGLLVRFTPDGQLDSTFDDDGIVVTSSSGLSLGMTSLVVESDGTIMTAGTSQASLANPSLIMAHYDSTGALISAMGGGAGGIMTVAPSGTDAGWDVTAQDLALTNNGVVLATTLGGDTGAAALLKYINGGTSITRTATATIANVAPVVTLSGAPSGAVEGDTISFTGSATDVAADQASVNNSVAWSVTRNGLALPGASGSGTSVSFVAPDNGDYVVTLAATDKDGATSTVTRPFSVVNVAPTININAAPTTGVEGTQIAFNAAVSDVPADQAATVWHVTRGTTAIATGTGTAISFTPDDNGSYVITATATDHDNASTSITPTTIVVSNVAPTVSGISGVPAGNTSPEGAPITLSATAYDVGAADRAAGLTYAWNVTKGTDAYTSGSGSTFTFTPNDNASYTVSLTVTDKDGGSVSAAPQTITVTNVAPHVSISGAPTSSIMYGTTVALSATATDDSSVDQTAGLAPVWTISQNGTTIAASLGTSINWTPTTSGTYVATFSSTDKDGANTTASATITVVGPSAAITSASSSNVQGQAVAFAGTASSTASGDVLQVSWDFGDGTTPIAYHAATDSGALTPSHVVNAAGTYTATLSVRNGAGVVATATQSYTVSVMQVQSGNLVIGGTSGNDVITVAPATGGGLTVTVNGTSYAAAVPTGSIVIYGYAGSDSLRLASTVTRPTSIYGGAGDDTLQGGGGNDTLDGGDGNDAFLTASSADGADTYIGGAGSDWISYGYDSSTTRTTGVSLSEDGVANDGAAGEGDNIGSDIETLIGGLGNDSLTTGGAANYLAGQAGDDWLICISSDGNSTQLYGGSGSDAVFYNRWSNVSMSADGVANDGDAGEGDVIGSDVEALYGGMGNDIISTGGGASYVSGGGGNDTITTGSSADGADTIVGGDGTDTLSYADRTSAVQIAEDGAANDGDIAASEADNVGTDVEVLTGGSGNDIVYGHAGVTTINGGAGDDVLVALSDNNTATAFNGGSGTDRVDYEYRTAGLYLALDATANDGETGEGDNIGSDIEVIWGGSGNDVLVGGSGNDTLYGLGGHDTLQGNAGNDNLYGGSGNDTITGGAGADNMYGEDGDDVIYARDNSVDTVNGGVGSNQAQIDRTSTGQAVNDTWSNIQGLIA